MQRYAFLVAAIIGGALALAYGWFPELHIGNFAPSGTEIYSWALGAAVIGAMAFLLGNDTKKRLFMLGFVGILAFVGSWLNWQLFGVFGTVGFFGVLGAITTSIFIAPSK